MSPRASRTFGPDVVEVRAARSFAASTVRGWTDRIVADLVGLVVSELAANAVVHARSNFTVALDWTGSRLTIEVQDASPERPTLTKGPVGASNGRGLLIVDRLSSQWGVRPAAGPGKVVWAVLEPGYPDAG